MLLDWPLEGMSFHGIAAAEVLYIPSNILEVPLPSFSKASEIVDAQANQMSLFLISAQAHSFLPGLLAPSSWLSSSSLYTSSHSMELETTWTRRHWQRLVLGVGLEH